MSFLNWIIGILAGLAAVVSAFLVWQNNCPRIKVMLKIKTDKNAGNKPYFELIISNAGKQNVFAVEAQLYAKNSLIKRTRLLKNAKPLNIPLEVGGGPKTTTIKTDFPGLKNYDGRSMVCAEVTDQAGKKYKSSNVGPE